MTFSQVILLLLVISIAFSESCIKFYESNGTTVASTSTTEEPVCLMSMVTQRNVTVTNPVLIAKITSPGPDSMLIYCSDTSAVDYSVEIDNNYILKSPLYLYCGSQSWSYYTKDLRILPVTTFDCTNAAPNVAS